MKLSRKTLAAVSAAVALVMGSVFTSCSSDDEDPFNLINVDGDNATIDAQNDGTLTADADGKTATDATFIRGFKTPKTTGWKAAVYKLTINKASSGGVMGWVFDEDKIDASKSESGEAEYSFYCLGLKATNDHPSIYLSRFNNVTQSGLTGEGTTFGTEYTMIDSGSPSSTTSGSKWYYQLSDIDYDSEGTATIYAGFKQVNKDGRYSFRIFSNETDAKTWYNGNEAYTGTIDGIEPNTLNAVNIPTNGGIFASTYKTAGGENSSINNFGITTDGQVRDNQVGFYAMIPKGGSLNGSFTKKHTA